MTTIPRNRDVFGLTNTVLDGKFRIDRSVAEGGFAVVYRATHEMLARPVALKVLKNPPGLDPAKRGAFIDGFTREARTIVRLNHPAIVQVLDFGVSPMPNGERAPWMALEWLDGRTLRQELAARRGQGGRSPIEALAMLRPAIEALAYAHEEGVAHRDVKPANMVLVETRRGPVLKLLDFGIAKAMDDQEDAGSGATQTTADLQAFSLQYAAPEQLGGTRTGPWTDVHALALIMTEVLTDQAPYPGEDRTEIMCHVLGAERPTPRRRGVDVGPLEGVLARAMAIKPADRYRTAGELLLALDQTLAGAGAVMHFAPGSTGAWTAAPARTDAPGVMPGESFTTLRGASTNTGANTAPGRASMRTPLMVVGAGAAVSAMILGVALAMRGPTPEGPVTRAGVQPIAALPTPAPMPVPVPAAAAAPAPPLPSTVAAVQPAVPPPALVPPRIAARPAARPAPAAAAHEPSPALHNAAPRPAGRRHSPDPHSAVEID